MFRDMWDDLPQRGRETSTLADTGAGANPLVPPMNTDQQLGARKTCIPI